MKKLNIFIKIKPCLLAFSLTFILTNLSCSPKDNPGSVPALPAQASRVPEPTRASEVEQSGADILTALSNRKLEGLWGIEGVFTETSSQTVEFKGIDKSIQIKFTAQQMIFISAYKSDSLDYSLTQDKIVINPEAARKIFSLHDPANSYGLVTQLTDSSLTFKLPADSPGLSGFTVFKLKRLDPSKERILVPPKPEAVAPAAVQTKTGPIAKDFPDSDARIHPKYKIRFIPLIKSDDYTIWANDYGDDRNIVRRQSIVIRTKAGEYPGEETADFEMPVYSNPPSYHWVQFVRRAIALKDGSFLFVETEGSNINGAYRSTYIVHTDANLVQDKKYGKLGTFGLDSDRSRLGYRFIRKIEETSNGGIMGVQKLCVREGEPDYSSSECLCSGFKLSKTGRQDMSYGRRGFSKMESCEGI